MANDEKPRYTDKNDLIRRTKPEDPQPELNDALKEFCNSVELIIHTVNDIEKAAVLELVKRPRLDLGLGQTPPEKPVQLPDFRIILGMFADRKCAVIQTKQGRDCGREVKKALLKCPTARLILAIGVAWGNPIKAKLGDVLCSASKICAYRNMKFDKGKIWPRDDSEEQYKPPDQIYDTFKQESDWDVNVRFECSEFTKGGKRYSEAHIGAFFSWEVLLNDKDVRNGMLARYQEAVGGEMEGVQLLEIRTDIKEEVFSRDQFEVVIIKGMADFADGTKNDEWQLTAAKAAANYTEYCMNKQTRSLLQENTSQQVSNPTNVDPHSKQPKKLISSAESTSTSQQVDDSRKRPGYAVSTGIEPENSVTNQQVDDSTNSKRPKYDPSADESLTISDVMKFTTKMSSDWNELGRALGVSLDERDEIDREKIKATAKLEKVLSKWLHGADSKPTWKKFIKALENIKRNDIVREIKEHLEQK